MGWLDQILNMLRGFDYYGAPDPEEEERRLRLSSDTALSGPPAPRDIATEYRAGEVLVPWDKPGASRRDYSGGYKEGFPGGGTLSIGKMTPDWAPKSEDDQLSSIYTTAALQQLVTGRPVDSRYGDAVAGLRNAATLERQNRDLAPGRDVETRTKEYLLALAKQGRLEPKDAINAAGTLVRSSADEFGGPNPEIASAAAGLLRRAAGIGDPMEPSWAPTGSVEPPDTGISPDAESNYHNLPVAEPLSRADVAEMKQDNVSGRILWKSAKDGKWYSMANRMPGR